nr:immunoglobulin heavy chain junction region [Macaca mulatta]MOV92118.1 immunoglobulin heavy chain junction region [Macaca mulatta]
FARKEDSLDVW